MSCNLCVGIFGQLALHVPRKVLVPIMLVGEVNGRCMSFPKLNVYCLARNVLRRGIKKELQVVFGCTPDSINSL